MAYHNPHITAQYHPLYPKQSGFFFIADLFLYISFEEIGHDHIGSNHKALHEQVDQKRFFWERRDR